MLLIQFKATSNDIRILGEQKAVGTHTPDPFYLRSFYRRRVRVFVHRYVRGGHLIFMTFCRCNLGPGRYTSAIRLVNALSSVLKLEMRGHVYKTFKDRHPRRPRKPLTSRNVEPMRLPIPHNLGSRVFSLRSPRQNFRYPEPLTINTKLIALVHSKKHRPQTIERGPQINGVPIYHRKFAPANLEVRRPGEEGRRADDARPRLDRGCGWRVAAGVRVPSDSAESPASDGEVFGAGEVMHGGLRVHARSWAVEGEGGKEYGRAHHPLYTSKWQRQQSSIFDRPNSWFPMVCHNGLCRDPIRQPDANNRAPRKQSQSDDAQLRLDGGCGWRIAAGIRVPSDSATSPTLHGKVMHGGQRVHARSWAVGGWWKGTGTGFHTTLYIPARAQIAANVTLKYYWD
ncbi:hypothetical protein BJ912DRAFT_479420 [Pholiota molesta]|nr:hypothetical protein BJ912DRAFT_479420 [Pholiota molesta]